MTQPPTAALAPESLESIVTQGLCTGCGLCQSIAGVDRVQLRMNGEHGERPVVRKSLDAATLATINAICPGIHCEGIGSPDAAAIGAPESTAPAAPIAAPTTAACATATRAAADAPTANIADRNVPIDPLWGPTVWMATGHAADPQVRFHASSGGALSALSNFLLETGEVDFILHVAACADRPLRSTAQLSFTTDQVMQASGSRYGPAAPLIDFRSVLERGRPFAFVGKPCDISAIRNYARLNPRVDELLRYTLNFFCGGVSEWRKTLDYVRKLGWQEDDVAHLRYRGDGCPGPMILRSHAGQECRFDYNEMWEDESRWQLQFRCKICPDSIGECADVTVADVWPGGKPDTEGLGFNGFIARTGRGARLLNAAVRARAITLTEDLDFAGLELAQGSHTRRKKGLAARLRALRDAGVTVPRFEGLRLDEADGLLDDQERHDNYQGMRGATRGDLTTHLRGYPPCRINHGYWPPSLR